MSIIPLQILAGARRDDAGEEADEGGLASIKFPAIQAWLERVKAQPRHIKITDNTIS